MDELIFMFLEGNITKEELYFLKHWLSKEEDNRKYFKQLLLIWKTSQIAGMNTKIIDKALDKTFHKIAEMNEVNTENLKD